MSLQSRLSAFITAVGADIKSLNANKVSTNDSRLLANTVTVVYTTVVPSRPTIPNGYYVIWQGSADPAANAQPGDEWHPVS